MFHVSKRDLGASVTLIPSIPLNAGKDECRITPRVCFAPTVEQCVIGIVGYAISQRITFLGAFAELANSERCPTVYYTDELLHEPQWVNDYHITHEEWALNPITVERVGYIDCVAMVKHRRIDLCDTPVYVNDYRRFLTYHMTDVECDILLSVVS